MALVEKIIRPFLYSIRTKLLLAFSIVVIVSVVFVTYFPISAYSQRLESNSIRYSNQVISNYISNIDRYIQELENITDTLLYNFYIQRYLIDKAVSDSGTGLTDESRSADFYQSSTDTLSSIIELRPDVNAIYIMDNQNIALYKSRYKDLSLESIYEKGHDLGQDLLESNSKIIYDVYYPTYNVDPTPTLAITRPLDRYDGLGTLGTVMMDANLSIIEQFGDSLLLDSGAALMVLTADGYPIYQTPRTPANMVPEYISTQELRTSLKDNHKSNKSGFFITTYDDETYHIVYNSITETNWVVATITPEKAILAEANEIRNSIVLITLLSLIIILLITFIISTRLTKPIIALKHSMDDIDHNDKFNTTVQVTSNDEIGALTESFNHMITRIQTLMDQVVIEQEEKRTAEIQVLQDQINPHFLYNTLDTIIWMTETDDENTVPMIEALSQLFRISLNKGQEFITIENELEHTRNYLYILTFRYLNKFDYTITADDKLLHHKIPKIVLQPLIENAIYHGIKNITKKGHIRINVSSNYDDILISISDDGIGMDQETCQRLLSEDHPSKSSRNGSGVGIRNVNKRIKLYYGSRYGLKYESHEGKGTTVVVKIPMQ